MAYCNADLRQAPPGLINMIKATLGSTTKGLETTKKGGIQADDNGQTSREGVFAGGDAVTGAATVILAMGAGKTGAKSIDEYIKNKKK